MLSLTVQFLLAFLVVGVVLQCSVEAFSVKNGGTAHRSPSRIGSSTSLEMTVLSYNGKKKDFKAGSPLSKAVQQLGVKPRYSCKKGECATCQIFLAGRAIKPCVAKVPEEPRLKSLQEKGLEIRV